MGLTLSNDLSNHALQIASQGQLVKFTKGQKALLEYMKLCVKNKKPLSWDIIVRCFVENVNATYLEKEYLGRGEDGMYKYHWVRKNIIDAYNENNNDWKYGIRSRVKQWFVSTIGILVIKNQLIVLPVINIEE